MALTDKDGKFNTALLDYVRRGSVELMQSLLRNDNPDSLDLDGKTLLHHAAESNNISMTQHFINNNYDVNIPDNRGNSPLMLAVAKDSVDTTKLLVEAGADIYNIYILHDENDASETPPSKLVIDLRNPTFNRTYELVKSILKRLQNDYYNDEKKLLEYLRDFGCSLIQLLSLRNANITRLMLENGYSVDERDLHTKGTALHKAVTLGYFDNVKVLLEFGASVDALDGNKYPPLYYLYDSSIFWRSDFSREKGERMAIMKILIEHGALSSQAPNDPMTPVQYIFEYGDVREITALMQYDVDFNSYASLLSLLDNANDSALEVLRGRNVNVNAVRDGASLLSIAVGLGSWRKVQFLLEHGADPNVGNGGETPLINAFIDVEPDLQGNLLAIVRSLLQYGADAQFAYTEEQLTVFDLWDQGEQVLELIIAHLALIESCGVRISELIRGKIDSRDTYRLHFQVCKNQIEEMKETAINGSVTLYKLLTKSHMVITRYARDPEFTAKFGDAMKVKWYLDPHFSISLHKRVGKAIREAKLKGEALIVLKQIFPCRFRNCHGIFDGILDYLTWDDLKNVCKVYDLQESELFNLNTVFV